MVLPITLVTAAAAGLINIWLALRVTGVRKTANVWLGDGGSEAVVARTRAHANFAEYAPFVLILVALIELARGLSLWLWLIAILFIVARLAHGIGMDAKGARWLRPFGAVSTLVVLLVLSAWALVIGYQVAVVGPAAPVVISVPPTAG